VPVSLAFQRSDDHFWVIFSLPSIQSIMTPSSKWKQSCELPRSCLGQYSGGRTQQMMGFSFMDQDGQSMKEMIGSEQDNLKRDGGVMHMESKKGWGEFEGSSCKEKIAAEGTDIRKELDEPRKYMDF
jgi:hypothetical protein